MNLQRVFELKAEVDSLKNHLAQERLLNAYLRERVRELEGELEQLVKDKDNSCPAQGTK